MVDDISTKNSGFKTIYHYNHAIRSIFEVVSLLFTISSQYYFFKNLIKSFWLELINFGYCFCEENPLRFLVSTTTAEEGQKSRD